MPRVRIRNAFLLGRMRNSVLVGTGLAGTFYGKTMWDIDGDFEDLNRELETIRTGSAWNSILDDMHRGGDASDLKDGGNSFIEEDSRFKPKKLDEWDLLDEWTKPYKDPLLMGHDKHLKVDPDATFEEINQESSLETNMEKANAPQEGSLLETNAPRQESLLETSAPDGDVSGHPKVRSQRHAKIPRAKPHTKYSKDLKEVGGIWGRVLENMESGRQHLEKLYHNALQSEQLSLVAVNQMKGKMMQDDRNSVLDLWDTLILGTRQTRVDLLAQPSESRLLKKVAGAMRKDSEYDTSHYRKDFSPNTGF